MSSGTEGSEEFTRHSEVHEVHEQQLLKDVIPFVSFQKRMELYSPVLNPERQSAVYKWTYSQASTAENHQQPPPEETQSAVPSELGGSSVEARPPRRRDQNWTPQEKQAFLELREEASRVVPGPGWHYISRRLRDRHTIERNPTSCENLWGTLLKPFKLIKEHQSTSRSTKWVSFWDMNADERFKNNLPRSFPQEWYATMERSIASKNQHKGGRLCRRPSRKRQQSVDHEVNASQLHPADPSRLYFGSEMLEAFLLDIPYDGEDQFATGFDSALDCLRPSSEQTIPGATDGNVDDPVATLSSRLIQVVQDAVTSTLQAAGTDESASIPIHVPMAECQLIAERVKFALEPVSAALLALKHDDQMFEQEKRALDKKKRALAREEEQLLKRQRVANRRPHCNRQGSAALPTLEGLSITSCDDLSLLEDLHV